MADDEYYEHDYASCTLSECPECALYQDSLDSASQDEDWDAHWEALFNGHHDTREEERGER